MVNIIHRVGIKAPASQVYAALATIEGLSGWWTEHTVGDAHVGGIIDFEFRMPNGDVMGNIAMQVVDLTPDKQVHWHCMAGPAEWIGTEIVFDLVDEAPYTIVRFTHQGWREQVEFTAHCSTKWAVFLMSLKQLVETGNGQAAPHDVKIDNWN